jgi:hypothetical protein
MESEGVSESTPEQIRAVKLAEACGCRRPQVHFGVARVQLEIECERKWGKP